MSLRIDPSEWISGALLIGDTGLGVLGSEIASTGTDGPGYAYNDLSLPADAGKEICGRITTWPSAGTLAAYEDTSFSFTDAPNGTYTFQYQLYVDGVSTGSPATVTLNVGSSSTATATAAAGVATVSAVGASTAAATASAAPGEATVSATGASTAASTGTAAGTATSSAVASSTAASTAAASGTAAASAAGSSVAAATPTAAAGVATVSAVGSTDSSATASSATPAAGIAAAGAVGSSTATASATAAGTATVSAVGASTTAATATPAAGFATVSGIGADAEAIVVPWQTVTIRARNTSTTVAARRTSTIIRRSGMTRPLEKTGYDNALFALDCSDRLQAFGDDVLITGTPTVTISPATTPPLVASDIAINVAGTGVTLRLSGGAVPSPLAFRDYYCQLRHSTNASPTVIAEPFVVRVRET